MDVIAITRQLGAAIQKDERYLNFVKAQENSESDTDVKAMIDQINELRETYQKEAESENPNEANLAKLDGDFQKLYTALMVNENMNSFENSRQELDAMMNYIMQILYLCVNGEDPETCEPEVEEQGCGGECSSCCGC